MARHAPRCCTPRTRAARRPPRPAAAPRARRAPLVRAAAEPEQQQPAAPAPGAAPAGQQQPAERKVVYNTEFGYSRKDIFLIGAGLIGLGYAMYYGLQAAGMDAGMAGNWVQLIIFLGICVGWVSTYLYRVATKVRAWTHVCVHAGMRARMAACPSAHACAAHMVRLRHTRRAARHAVDVLCACASHVACGLCCMSQSLHAPTACITHAVAPASLHVTWLAWRHGRQPHTKQAQPPAVTSFSPKPHRVTRKHLRRSK